MIKVTESIKAKTHAEFLNQIINRNYKQYLSSICSYNENTVIWMIRLDNKDREGFSNYREGEDIVEFSKKPTRSQKTYRLVFEINESKGYRQYIYLGKFSFNDKKSDLNHHYFTLID